MGDRTIDAVDDLGRDDASRYRCPNPHRKLPSRRASIRCTASSPRTFAAGIDQHLDQRLEIGVRASGDRPATSPPRRRRPCGASRIEPMDFAIARSAARSTRRGYAFQMREHRTAAPSRHGHEALAARGTITSMPPIHPPESPPRHGPVGTSVIEASGRPASPQPCARH